MADMDAIQSKLNSQPAEKAAFLADPVAYLNKHGIALSPEAAKALASQVANAAVKQKGASPQWSVGITVGT
jgi:hypothetical protein